MRQLYRSSAGLGRPDPNLNLDIHDAVTHDQALYRVRILDDPDPFAEKSRDAARSEFASANRGYNEARQLSYALK